MLKFWDFFPHNKYIFSHQGKPVVPVLSLYSWSFVPVGWFKCPGKIIYFMSGKGDCRKLELNFPLLSNFMCLVCRLPSSVHCCPLIALFPFFDFVLGPFFPVVNAHSPFVHNVRLFIFHSCLLPCLFYFLLPLSFFCFFFKDVNWTVSGPFWNVLELLCFGHF